LPSAPHIEARATARAEVRELAGRTGLPEAQRRASRLADRYEPRREEASLR
jgi:hypothetical protein